MIKQTLLSILALDSTSKNEHFVASFVSDELVNLGFKVKKDSIGNVIGYLPGTGKPLLLNAHMDRVPEGKGHRPQIKGDIVSSDGTTNLGADDAAGITVILEACDKILQNSLPHPPLVIAFTVQEEIGLFGAKALDLSEFNVSEGIVYDNAFEAGVIVGKGAAYVAFDIEITGTGGHPGKDLMNSKSVLKTFVDARIKLGAIDKGNSRVNIGKVIAGSARNAIPNLLLAQGEIRSFLEKEELTNRVNFTKDLFINAAKLNRTEIKFTSNQLAVAYSIEQDEPLVQMYRQVIMQRGGIFQRKNTFVASDANALRGEKGLKVFVVSTGVQNEHSKQETVNLTDLEQLTTDLITLLQKRSLS